MPNQKPKNILIAPLDWGAGHTTRCMPIVAHLVAQGYKPLVAGNEAQLAMVHEAFGAAIDTVFLEGYNITYTPLNRIARTGLLLQMPRLLNVIKAEHQWLQHIVRERHIDAIISDNRYGLYHPSIPSVIMTHQLHILTGMGNIADNMIQRLHYRYLNRFSATWVVDTQGAHALAGALSHTEPLPRNVSYIGLLSRFAGDGVDYNAAQYNTLLILLSGPEPQRSILSALLWQQAQAYKGKIIFAEGSDTAPRPAHIPAHIAWSQRLAGQQLTAALQQARLVVCRSGYSTLMDLTATGKRAILIPTPGQTEQEYLGKKLHDRGIHHSSPQQQFHLQQSVAAAEQLTAHQALPAGVFTEFRSVVDEWLIKCS